MVSCTYWVTTTKPIAAKWTALNGSCENGSDWHDELRLALCVRCRAGWYEAAHSFFLLVLCAQCRACRFYPADFLVPDLDLPRTGPHDHGPRPRAFGNL